jgi:hypothetical protein
MLATDKCMSLLSWTVYNDEKSFIFFIKGDFCQFVTGKSSTPDPLGSSSLEEEKVTIFQNLFIFLMMLFSTIEF